MQTNTISWRFIGLIVVSLAAITGCRSYQRTSSLPQAGSNARVEGRTPFPVVPSSGGESGCQAKSIDGVVSEASSEAISFSQIKNIDKVDSVGSACSRLGAGTVGLRDGAEVKVRRFSVTRTLMLLGSIIGLIALSVGQASVGGI